MLIIKKLIKHIGAGSENRTRTLGSEAPYSTIKLYPRNVNKKTKPLNLHLAAFDGSGGEN